VDTTDMRTMVAHGTTEATKVHARVQSRGGQAGQTSGKSIGQVSSELELTETAVRAWVKRADVDEKKDPNGPLTSEERGEVTRLRRELRTVTMERDFLRKAAAFFARSGK
jgi:transposase